MFTGLVQWLATVASVVEVPPGKRIAIVAGELAETAKVGDSVAINGCCLTVVAKEEDRLTFEAGPETLRRTTLGRLTVGSRVNIERSLRVGDMMGGHFVSGHVDTIGALDQRADDGQWTTCWFRVPRAYGPHLAAKGSVTVDGVSLTLVDVEPARFSVALIPHTLASTTLGHLSEGDEVNIETDILAKYVERILMSQLEASREPPLLQGPHRM